MGITNLEDLADQVATLLGRTAEAQAAAGGKAAAAKKAAAKKAPAKKATARRRQPRRRRPRRRRPRRRAAKKAAAKKTAAKKTPAKKAPAANRRPPSRDRIGVVRLTPPARQRLDRALVARGLADSRPQAVALIAQGVVLVSGSVADKPARLVAPAEPIELLGDRPRFVSRGGDKLRAALDRFALDPSGRRALDAGASTGGFTDCLLQAGADHVVAVDVGQGQLHPRLRGDPRVTVLERLDIRRSPWTRWVAFRSTW